MTTTFFMCEQFGCFMSDGDEANKFRFTEVEPMLAKGHKVIFDFDGVTNMTDSFCNALFANLVFNHPKVLSGAAEFRHCTPLVKDFIVHALSVGCREAGLQTV